MPGIYQFAENAIVLARNAPGNEEIRRKQFLKDTPTVSIRRAFRHFPLLCVFNKFNSKRFKSDSRAQNGLTYGENMATGIKTEIIEQ